MGARTFLNRAQARNFGWRESLGCALLALGLALFAPVKAEAADESCALRYARLMDDVLRAMDTQAKPTVGLDAATGNVRWLTPEAQRIIERAFGPVTGQDGENVLPATVADWIQRHVSETAKLPKDGIRSSNVLRQTNDDRQTTIELIRSAQTDDWILQVRERSEILVIGAIKESFKLPPKQAQVLYWVTQGKSDREIGEILGIAPSTAKKHVELIFKNLGVTNRIEATRSVLRRVPSLDE